MTFDFHGLRLAAQSALAAKRGACDPSSLEGESLLMFEHLTEAEVEELAQLPEAAA